MKRVVLLVMLTCLAPVASARCGPSWFSEHGVRKPVNVTLTGPPRNAGDPPVFYLRFERKEWFLLTVRPEDLVRTLEAFGAKPDGRATGDNGVTLNKLYEQVTRDLPLKEDSQRKRSPRSNDTHHGVGLRRRSGAVPLFLYSRRQAAIRALVPHLLSIRGPGSSVF